MRKLVAQTDRRLVFERARNLQIALLFVEVLEQHSALATSSPEPFARGATLFRMPQFAYLITVESSEPPTADALQAMTAVLAEQGFVDVQNMGDGKLTASGTNAARTDQLAFTLREKLGEIWNSTTVLVSEPPRQVEELSLRDATRRAIHPLPSGSGAGEEAK